jgi:hypothetical protein
VITDEATAREKDRLPRGWGRFGKAIDQLPSLAAEDETLLATCVGLNPTFKHRSVTLAGGLAELTQSTNVLLAATDRQLIVLATGAGGAPRDHAAIPRAGLVVAESAKKEVTLRWPEGEMHVRGCAKQMLPALVAALGGASAPRRRRRGAKASGAVRRIPPQ